MLDVHAIADDQLARDIKSWTVKTVEGDMVIGRIVKEDLSGEVRYRAIPLVGGESLYDSLVEARDVMAMEYTPPGYRM